MKTPLFFIRVAVLACAAAGGLFILSAVAQTGAPVAPVKPGDDPYQKIFDEQVNRTKRYEALLAKQEELMKKQEAACNHYMAILDKWDKQQAQYQKYLDSLPTTGGAKK